MAVHYDASATLRHFGLAFLITGYKRSKEILPWKNNFGDNIAVYPPLDSPPRVGGRRGVLASDATTETLGSPRSAEGFSPRRGGGGINIATIPPPLRSSPYVRGTILRLG